MEVEGKHQEVADQQLLKEAAGVEDVGEVIGVGMLKERKDHCRQSQKVVLKLCLGNTQMNSALE